MAGIPEPSSREEARARGKEAAPIAARQLAGAATAGGGTSGAPSGTEPRRGSADGAGGPIPASARHGNAGGSDDAAFRAAEVSAPAGETPGAMPPALAPQASLGRRLASLLYEALLLVAMALVAGFLFLPLVSPVGVMRHDALTIAPLFARTMMFCALVAGGAAYCTWCWSGGRRTLPQKTWRLRIVDAAGRALAPRTALLRYGAWWIGPAAAAGAAAVMHPAGYGRHAALFLALNYAWAFVDRDGRFLHDRIAGTRIVASA